jgi:hypothetical protein
MRRSFVGKIGEAMGLIDKLKRKKKIEAPQPLAAPKPEDVTRETPPAQVTNIPSELLWLGDAPLFIDNVQADAIYDAILRPDYELTSLTLENGISRTTTIGGQATVGVALPWFGKAQVQASGETAGTHDRSTSSGLQPITNSYRHLLSIALHYAGLSNNPETDRLARHSTTDSVANAKWLEDEYIMKSPRALVFLYFPPGTQFMPAALEVTKGKVKVITNEIEEKLKEKGKTLDAYPGSTAPDAARHRYFKLLNDAYDNQIALETLEEAAKDDKIAWIDFNVALDPEGTEFLHLHVVARDSADTGDFGYNFVRRGFANGMRIVGTLKSGPDLNVLAIFEV